MSTMSFGTAMAGLSTAVGPPPANTITGNLAVRKRGRTASDTSTIGCKIMIVDDEEYNVLVFRKYLIADGYSRIVTTADSRQAIGLLERERPDILLLDVMMPHVSGMEILEFVSSEPSFEHLPVLILTASSDETIRQKALDLGATDFLNKPVGAAELLPRVRNALLNKLYKDRLARHAEELEGLVRRRTAEVELSRREVVYCLARAAEFRDDVTGHHVIRVGRYVGVIARRLGFRESQVELLELAAQLHDIGKIGIPDSILRKPARLEKDEFTFMKKHCIMGQEILEWFPEYEWNRFQYLIDESASTHERRSPLLQLAGLIATTHHERWDGTGYPHGLSGEAIPIEGRMTAVADVFDSLSSERPYKPAYPHEKCLQILEEGRGSHFDPLVLDAFLSAQDEVLAIQRCLADRKDG